MASMALAKERLELETRAANLGLRQRALKIREEADKVVLATKGKLKAALEDGRTNVGVGAGARAAGIFGEALLRRKVDPKYHKLINGGAAIAAVASFTMAMTSKKAQDIALYNAVGSFAEGAATRFFISVADDIAANVFK